MGKFETYDIEPPIVAQIDYTKEKWDLISYMSNGIVSYSRIAIPGGWLVEGLTNVLTQLSDGRMDQGFDWRASIAFVPDPEHLWKI